MTTRNSNRSHSLFDDIVWGARHDAFDDDLGQSLIRAWSVGACDEHLEQMIHNIVRPLRTQEAFGTLLPFRNPRLQEGDVLLGRDPSGHDIYVPLQWLVSGLLIAANTGGGKSVLLCWLLLQIVQHGCVVWASDMYKSQIRQWRPLFRRTGVDLIVLRASDWKYNLLQASHCDPRKHLSMVLDLLMRGLALPPRARTILQQGCHSLYQQFSVWNGRTDAYPCLFDLYEWVRSTGGLNAAAREAILDRLGALLGSLTPQCAAYRKGWNPVDLARFSIDFEMRGSSELVKQLLLEPALYTLLHHQLDYGTVNAPIELFVAFEDSQRFFDAHQSSAAEITPMDELAGVIRGSGKGLGVIVQTMQGVSRRLIPNLATKIMGRQGSHEDYRRLGADLAMNPQQIDWARRNLKPGVFVAQVAEGNWREPFVLTVPFVKTPVVVSDKEVADSVRALDGLAVVPASEFARWEPHHLIHIAGRVPAPGPARAPQAAVKNPDHPASDPARVSAQAPPVSKEALDYLQFALQEPFLKINERDEKLGLSAWKGNRIRDELASKGLIKTVPVNPGPRGTRSLLIQLTEQGRNLAASLGMKVSQGHGRGGILHQWWTHTIVEWLRANRFEPIIEDDSVGARVDIRVPIPPDHHLAIEIETSPGNESHNIQKDLEAGYDQVLSLSKEPGQLSRVRALLPLDIPQDQVHLALLSDYSRILPGLLAESSSPLPPKHNQEPNHRPEANIPHDPESVSETGTSDPPTSADPSPLPLGSAGSISAEALLEAAIIGANVLQQARGGRKQRKRVPVKQERLLRLLSERGQGSLDRLTTEFGQEWNRIRGRKSGESANREFFRNMADLATRINEALAAAYRDAEARPEILQRAGGVFMAIEINHQSYTLALRSATSLHELEARCIIPSPSAFTDDGDSTQVPL
jgi:hypothetical protein